MDHDGIFGNASTNDASREASLATLPPKMPPEMDPTAKDVPRDASLPSLLVRDASLGGSDGKDASLAGSNGKDASLGTSLAVGLISRGIFGVGVAKEASRDASFRPGRPGRREPQKMEVGPKSAS